jgi:hypothetical protein
VRWDARWYSGIAFDGYGFSRVVADGRTLTDYAFFPLYPALERLVSDVTGLPILTAGLVISAMASVLAAWGIFAVAAHLFDARTGIILVALWSASPVSIVQSMAYTESLFTALAAWALYAVLRQRFVEAGILASLTGLTRPMGGAVVLAVIVAAALHIHSARVTGPDADRHPTGALVGALVAPLGIVAYLGYVGFREHDAAGYFKAADQWGNGVDGAASFATWIFQLLWGPDVFAGLLVCGAVGLLASAVVAMIRNRYPVPLLVFTLVSVLLALSTAGYFGSKPRYLVPLFPLLMPLAAYLAGKRVGQVAIGLAGLAVVSSVYGAFWLFGPGPP